MGWVGFGKRKWTHVRFDFVCLTGTPNNMLKKLYFFSTEKISTFFLIFNDNVQMCQLRFTIYFLISFIN